MAKQKGTGVNAPAVQADPIDDFLSKKDPQLFGDVGQAAEEAKPVLHKRLDDNPDGIDPVDAMLAAADPHLFATRGEMITSTGRYPSVEEVRNTLHPFPKVEDYALRTEIRYRTTRKVPTGLKMQPWMDKDENPVEDTVIEEKAWRNYDPKNGKIMPMKEWPEAPPGDADILSATVVKDDQLGPKARLEAMRLKYNEHIESRNRVVKLLKEYPDFANRFVEANPGFGSVDYTDPIPPPKDPVRRKERTFWDEAEEFLGLATATGLMTQGRVEGLIATPQIAQAYLDPKTEGQRAFSYAADAASIAAGLLMGGVGGAAAGAAKGVVKQVGKKALMPLIKKAGQYVMGSPQNLLRTEMMIKGGYGLASHAMADAYGLGPMSEDEMHELESNFSLDTSKMTDDDRRSYLKSFRDVMVKTNILQHDTVMDMMGDDPLSKLYTNAVSGIKDGLLSYRGGQHMWTRDLENMKNLSPLLVPNRLGNPAFAAAMDDFEAASIKRELQLKENTWAEIGYGLGNAAVLMPGFVAAIKSAKAKPLDVWGRVSKFKRISDALARTKNAPVMFESMKSRHINRLTDLRGAIGKDFANRAIGNAVRSFAVHGPMLNQGQVQDADYVYRRLLEQGYTPGKAALTSFGMQVASNGVEYLSESEYVPLFNFSRKFGEHVIKRLAKGVLATSLGEGFEETTGRLLRYGLEEAGNIPADLREQPEFLTLHEALIDYSVATGLGILTGGLRVAGHPIKSSRAIYRGSRMILSKNYVDTVTDKYAENYGFAGDEEKKKVFRKMIVANEGGSLKRLARVLGPSGSGAYEENEEDNTISAPLEFPARVRVRSTGELHELTGVESESETGTTYRTSTLLSDGSPVLVSSYDIEPAGTIDVGDVGEAITLVGDNSETTEALAAMTTPPDIPASALGDLADPAPAGEVDLARPAAPNLKEVMQKLTSMGIEDLREEARNQGINFSKNNNRSQLRRKIVDHIKQTELMELDTPPAGEGEVLEGPTTVMAAHSIGKINPIAPEREELFPEPPEMPAIDMPPEEGEFAAESAQVETSTAETVNVPEQQENPVESSVEPSEDISVAGLEVESEVPKRESSLQRLRRLGKEAEVRLAKKHGLSANPMLDVSAIPDLVAWGAGQIASGIMKLEEWSKAMYEKYGDSWLKIKDEVLGKVRNYTDYLGKLEKPLPGFKVIAGAQTGADFGALVGARRSKIEIGGTVLKGGRSESQSADRKRQIMAFVQEGIFQESSSTGYKDKTQKNVDNSDGTVVFDFKPGGSSGSKFTISYAKKTGKPVLEISGITGDTTGDILSFIDKHGIKTLNIAGNRESVTPGIERNVASVVGALAVELHRRRLSETTDLRPEAVPVETPSVSEHIHEIDTMENTEDDRALLVDGPDGFAPLVKRNRNIARNLELHVNGADMPPDIKSPFTTEELREIVETQPFLKAVATVRDAILKSNSITKEYRGKIHDKVYTFVARARQRREMPIVKISANLKFTVTQAYDIPPLVSVMPGIQKMFETFGFRVPKELGSAVPFFALDESELQATGRSLGDMTTEDPEKYIGLLERMAEKGIFLMGTPGKNENFIGFMADPESVAQSGKAQLIFQTAQAAGKQMLEKMKDVPEKIRSSLADELELPPNSKEALPYVARAAFYAFITGNEWKDDPLKVFKYMNFISTAEQKYDKEVALAGISKERAAWEFKQENDKWRTKSCLAQIWKATDEGLVLNAIEPIFEGGDPKKGAPANLAARLARNGWTLTKAGLAVKVGKEGEITDAKIVVALVEDSPGMASDGESYYSPGISYFVDMGTGAPKGRWKLGKLRILRPFGEKGGNLLWKGQFRPMGMDMQRVHSRIGTGMILNRSTVKLGKAEHSKAFTTIEKFEAEDGENQWLLLDPEYISKANDAVARNRVSSPMITQAFMACAFNTMAFPEEEGNISTIMNFFSKMSSKTAFMLQQIFDDQSLREAMMAEYATTIDEDSPRDGYIRRLIAAAERKHPWLSYLPHITTAVDYSAHKKMLSNLMDMTEVKGGSVRVIGTGSFLSGDPGMRDGILMRAVLNSAEDLEENEVEPILKEWFDVGSVQSKQDSVIEFKRRLKAKPEEGEDKPRWVQYYDQTYSRLLKEASWRRTETEEDKWEWSSEAEAAWAAREARERTMKMFPETFGKELYLGGRYFMVKGGTGQLKDRSDYTPIVISANKARKMGWEIGRKIVAGVIPTDASHSVRSGVVIGITNEVDDSIWWPCAVTKQLGKDHDGDKIYMYSDSEGHWEKKLAGLIDNEEDESTPRKRIIWSKMARHGYQEVSKEDFKAIWDFFNGPAKTYVADLMAKVGIEDAFSESANSFIQNFFPTASDIQLNSGVSPSSDAQITSKYVGRTKDAIGNVASTRNKLEQLIQAIAGKKSDKYKNLLSRKLEVEVNGRIVELTALECVYLANALLTNHAVDAPKNDNFFTYHYDATDHLYGFTRLLLDIPRPEDLPEEQQWKSRIPIFARQIFTLVSDFRTAGSGRIRPSLDTPNANDMTPINKLIGGGMTLGTQSRILVLRYLSNLVKRSPVLRETVLGRLASGFGITRPMGMSPNFWRIHVFRELMYKPNSEFITSVAGPDIWAFDHYFLYVNNITDILRVDAGKQASGGRQLTNTVIGTLIKEGNAAIKKGWKDSVEYKAVSILYQLQAMRSMMGIAADSDDEVEARLKLFGNYSSKVEEAKYMGEHSPVLAPMLAIFDTISSNLSRLKGDVVSDDTEAPTFRADGNGIMELNPSTKEYAPITAERVAEIADFEFMGSSRHVDSFHNQKRIGLMRLLLRAGMRIQTLPSGKPLTYLSSAQIEDHASGLLDPFFAEGGESRTKNLVRLVLMGEFRWFLNPVVLTRSGQHSGTREFYLNVSVGPHNMDMVSDPEKNESFFKDRSKKAFFSGAHTRASVAMATRATNTAVVEAIVAAEGYDYLNTFGFKYMTDDMREKWLNSVSKLHRLQEFMKFTELPLPQEMISEIERMSGEEIHELLDELETEALKIQQQIDVFMEQQELLPDHSGKPVETLTPTGDSFGRFIPIDTRDNDMVVPEANPIMGYFSGWRQQLMQVLDKVEDMMKRGQITLDKVYFKTAKDHLNRLHGFVDPISMVARGVHFVSVSSLRLAVIAGQEVVNAIRKGLVKSGNFGMAIKEHVNLVNGVISEAPIHASHILSTTPNGDIIFHDHLGKKIGNVFKPRNPGAPGLQPTSNIFPVSLDGLIKVRDKSLKWRKSVFSYVDGVVNNLLTVLAPGPIRGFGKLVNPRILDLVQAQLKMIGPLLTSFERIFTEQVASFEHIRYENGEPAVMGPLGEKDKSTGKRPRTWVTSKDSDLTSGKVEDEQIAFERVLLRELHHPKFMQTLRFVLNKTTGEWEWQGRADGSGMVKQFKSAEMVSFFMRAYTDLVEALQVNNHSVYSKMREMLVWQLSAIPAGTSTDTIGQMITRISKYTGLIENIEDGNHYFPVVYSCQLDNEVTASGAMALMREDTFLRTDGHFVGAAYQAHKKGTKLTQSQVDTVRIDALLSFMLQVDLDIDGAIERIANATSNPTLAVMMLRNLVENRRMVYNGDLKPRDVVFAIVDSRRQLSGLNLDDALVQARQEFQRAMLLEERRLPGGQSVFGNDIHTATRCVDMDAILAENSVLDQYCSTSDNPVKFLHQDTKDTILQNTKDHLTSIRNEVVQAMTRVYVDRIRALNLPGVGAREVAAKYDRWVRGNFKFNAFSQRIPWSRLQPGDKIRMTVYYKVPRLDSQGNVEIDKYTGQPILLDQSRELDAVVDGVDGPVFTMLTSRKGGVHEFTVNTAIGQHDGSISDIGNIKSASVGNLRTEVFDDMFERFQDKIKHSDASEAIKAIASNDFLIESSKWTIMVANMLSGASKLGLNFFSAMRNSVYAIMNCQIGMGNWIDAPKYYMKDVDNLIQKMIEREASGTTANDMTEAVREMLLSMPYQNFDFLSSASQMAGSDKIERKHFFKPQSWKQLLEMMQSYHRAKAAVDAEIRAAGLLGTMPQTLIDALRHEAVFDKWCRAMEERGVEWAKGFSSKRVSGEMYSLYMNTLYGMFAMTERYNRQMAFAMSLVNTGVFHFQSFNFGNIAGEDVRVKFGNLPESMQNSIYRHWAHYAQRMDERTNYDYANIMRKPILRQPIAQMLMKFGTFAMASYIWRYREARELAQAVREGAETTKIINKEKMVVPTGPFTRMMDYNLPIDPTWFNDPSEWELLMKNALAYAYDPKKLNYYIDQVKSHLEKQTGLRLERAHFNPMFRAIKQSIAWNLKFAIETSLAMSLPILGEPLWELSLSLLDMIGNFSGLWGGPDTDDLLMGIAYELSGLARYQDRIEWLDDPKNMAEAKALMEKRLKADPLYRYWRERVLKNTTRRVAFALPAWGGMLTGEAVSSVLDTILMSGGNGTRIDGSGPRLSLGGMAGRVLSIPAIDHLIGLTGDIYRTMQGDQEYYLDSEIERNVKRGLQLPATDWGKVKLQKAVDDLAKGILDPLSKPKKAGGRISGENYYARLAEARLKIGKAGNVPEIFRQQRALDPDQLKRWFGDDESAKQAENILLFRHILGDPEVKAKDVINRYATKLKRVREPITEDELNKIVDAMGSEFEEEIKAYQASPRGSKSARMSLAKQIATAKTTELYDRLIEAGIPVNPNPDEVKVWNEQNTSLAKLIRKR
jgi:hypothetical protein